jgi:hypothetical protein
MLSDSDIAKLSFGRIDKAVVLSSSENHPVEPHYGVMLDSNEAIREHDNYFLAIISTNDKIDSRFLVPVPARTGLAGNIVCSWCPSDPIELAAIREVHPHTLSNSEMAKVFRMIRAYRDFLRSIRS